MAMKAYIQQKQEEREQKSSYVSHNTAHISAQSFNNVPAYQRHNISETNRNAYLENNLRNTSENMAEIEQVEIPENVSTGSSRFGRRGGRSQMQLKDSLVSNRHKWSNLKQQETFARKPVVSHPVDSDRVYHEYTIQHFEKTIQRPSQEQLRGPLYKRQQEFYLPAGVEQSIAKQHERSIKKWPRMPGMKQRPDRLVDPDR
jgi:hypothetical protein